MAGPKTHELFTRKLERKPDPEKAKAARATPPNESHADRSPAISPGTHHESQHNKHNHPERGADKQ